MQGWHYGKGLIYYRPHISGNKISLPQGQNCTERKYLFNAAPKFEFEIHISG